MIISSVRLSNFMNIKSADLSFLENGINILYGENGSGKSAVLSAIAFSLFEYRRGDSWKDYIQHNKESFLIELKFNHNNHEYFLITDGNSKKPSVERTLYKDGLVYKNSDAQKILQQDIDLHVVEHIIFSMQLEDPITRLNPLDRKKLFLNIFNINFETLLEELSSEKQKLQEELIAVKEQIKFLNQKTYTFYRTQTISELDISQLQNLINKKQEELSNYLGITQIKNQIDLINQQIDSKYKQIEEYKTFKSQIENKINKNEEIRLNFLKDIDRIEKETEEIKKQYESILKEKERILNDLNLFLSKEDNNISALKERESKLLGLRKWKIHQIELFKSGKCYECGQECDTSKVPELESEKEKIEKDIFIIQKEISEKQYYIDYCNNQINEKDKLLNKLLQDLSFNEKMLMNIKSEVVRMESSLKDLRNNYDHISKSISETEVEIKELDNNKNELSNKLNEYNVSYYERLINEIKDLEQQLEKKKMDKKLFDNYVILNQQTKIQKEKDEQLKKELLEKLNNTEKNILVNSTLRNIFEVDFPSFVISSSCKYLEEYMNSFLMRAKTDLKISLKQTKKGIDFFYNKINSKNDDLKVKLASGFETAILDFAFKSAIAKIYNSELLILDEPDYAASENSSLNFFEALLNTANDFKQMFIITHKLYAAEFLQKNNMSKTFYVKNGNISLL